MQVGQVIGESHHVFSRLPAGPASRVGRSPSGAGGCFSGDSYLWLGRAEFRGVWSGGCPDAAHSSRGGRHQLYRPDQRQHHCPAHHRLLLVSPNDPRFSPLPVVARCIVPGASTGTRLWLLRQSLAGACTAMSGVAAVSNGVKAFREPVIPTARRTLTIIIALLIVLLAGIAYLVRAYGIGATDPGRPGYQSVLSMLLAAVAGKGLFYYVSIGSILLVLALSANTAFADFPRLCRAIAQNNYLPHSFATRGRRLVYSQGIYVLAGLAGLLLILFDGVTDRLIPLFAVGAFLAFTLSQAGMVGHWKRVGGPGAKRSRMVNS